MSPPTGFRLTAIRSDQPELRLISRGLYEVVRDWWYCWDHDGVQYAVRVRAGFTTDIASVPRVARWLIQPDGLHRAAAVVHDWFYQHMGLLPAGCFYVWNPASGVAGGWDENHARWSRRDVDRLFCRMLREYGVPRWKRRLMFRAVRVGGGLFWYT